MERRHHHFSNATQRRNNFDIDIVLDGTEMISSTNKRRSCRSSPKKGASGKKAATSFSYGHLAIDGTLLQTVVLLEREKDNLLNTLLILEQLVVEWRMTIEEVQDHVSELELEDDRFIADGGDEEWEEDEEPGANSNENDAAEISPQTISVKCFLLGALDLDVSFKIVGRPGGLEDAKRLVETLYNLAENACAGVGTGSHTPQQRAAAYAPLRGRAWYTWTLSDVLPMIELLRETALCHASSAQEAPPETEIFPFTKFLSHHWGITTYLDPHLVVAEGGTPMPVVGPVGMAVNPIAAGWASSFVTNNRGHALIRASAWLQAGAPRVAVATFNAGTFIHF